ncbi:MAG TPA: polyprenyl synthetase family protein, partial [Chitinispirillaceae bacterium]|nr:polyprenyl synthetase family protein [Chitinispirillaceae bacterium]
DDESLIRNFREIGHNLGLAFQIRDDVLGIWGDAQETGKSSGNDIRRRKKSFPVVFALENIENSQREDLISIYQNSSLHEKAVKQVLKIFESVDTHINAQKTVDQYSSLAIRTFEGLPVSNFAKEEMNDLVQFLTGRTF